MNGVPRTWMRVPDSASGFDDVVISVGMKRAQCVLVPFIGEARVGKVRRKMGCGIITFEDINVCEL